MSELLSRANAYVAQQKGGINAQYRPHFHVATPIGWINDPNGFCVYKGRYHLFAQFHPYDNVWGPMHWGHWVSDDLITWEWVSVALAPDSEYDNLGCFSGTALQVDEKLMIIYTGVHKNEEGIVIQEQCIAQSVDGVHFTKWDCNPVISAKDLPADGLAQDFRDPKLIRTDKGFRVIVANRTNQKGRQLSFVSEDLKDWTYEGVLLEDIGDMPECPDYSTCADKKLMLTSVIGIPPEGMRFQNGHHDVVYLLGEEKDGRLEVERMESVDLGPDFYAPESIVTPDGRHVMIGWMDMWQTDSPLRYLHHGWRGQFTIARELSVRDGRLYQQPVRELKKLRGEIFEASGIGVEGQTRLPGLSGRRFELEIELEVPKSEMAEIQLLKREEEYFSIRYDGATHVLTTDRSHCGYTMGENGSEEKKPMGQAKLWDGAQNIRLQIIVDACSVEVFANGGSTALTTLAFPKGEAEEIGFAGRFLLRTIKKWELADA